MTWNIRPASVGRPAGALAPGLTSVVEPGVALVGGLHQGLQGAQFPIPVRARGAPLELLVRRVELGVRPLRELGVDLVGLRLAIAGAAEVAARVIVSGLGLEPKALLDQVERLLSGAVVAVGLRGPGRLVGLIVRVPVRALGALHQPLHRAFDQRAGEAAPEALVLAVVPPAVVVVVLAAFPGARPLTPAAGGLVVLVDPVLAHHGVVVGGAVVVRVPDRLPAEAAAVLVRNVTLNRRTPPRRLRLRMRRRVLDRGALARRGLLHRRKVSRPT